MVCLFLSSVLLRVPERVRTSQSRHAKPSALPARGESILFMNSSQITCKITLNQINTLSLRACRSIRKEGIS